MKISSKPISSPSRTDKFPPPLMLRFLKTNIGSRSTRGVVRSRSSPMFIRQKNKTSTLETTTQVEPSSPKVTCIGQVRVKRSSHNRTGRSKTQTQTKQRPCSCIRIKKSLFFHHFSKFRRPNLFSPSLRKWVMFFRFGYCKKVDIIDHSTKLEPNGTSQYEENGNEDEERDYEKEAVVEESNDVFKCSEPPKNALLLTRCRSAPYRSSSLANRFWGSPGDCENEVKNGSQQQPILERDPNWSVESIDDQERERKLGICKEFEDSINGKVGEDSGQGLVQPLILTRCKSEPARTGDRLNPEPRFRTHNCD